MFKLNWNNLFNIVWAYLILGFVKSMFRWNSRKIVAAVSVYLVCLFVNEELEYSTSKWQWRKH